MIESPDLKYSPLMWYRSAGLVGIFREWRGSTWTYGALSARPAAGTTVFTPDAGLLVTGLRLAKGATRE